MRVQTLGAFAHSELQLFRRGCKTIGPRRPGSISPWLFQVLVSHHYGGKQKQETNKTSECANNNIAQGSDRAIINI